MKYDGTDRLHYIITMFVLLSLPTPKAEVLL